MKILTQDKRILIDTDYIYTYDLHLAKCILKANQDEDVDLATYEDYEYTGYSYSLPISAENPTGAGFTTKIIKGVDICKKVVQLMYRYFLTNPDGIYEMPSQEEIEIILKGEEK